MSYLREGKILDRYLRTRSGKYGRITRGVMTPKRTPYGWYKGVGCRSLGRHTRKGKYIVVQSKVPVFIMPDLTNFPLKPYVSHSTPKLRIPPLRLPTKKERREVVQQMVREREGNLEGKEQAQMK